MRRSIYTVGAKEARTGEVHAVMHLEVGISRRYIWVMKLRYIWAIIRAKPADIYKDGEGE